MTQEDAKRVTDELLEVAQPLHDLIKEIENGKTGDFTADANKVAARLCAVARICSQSAQNIIQHVASSAISRRLDEMQAEKK